MLEALQIKNFQKHKLLRIKFGKRITTLVGRSDAGKSAVIRALSVLCLNTPSGTSYITKGEELASIQLLIDGKLVSRYRSKSRNEYKLDKKRFKAFGASVPTPIAEVLNVEDNNFQFQLDSPFWFMETNSSVSKKLNSLVNLELLDKMMANLASKVRTRKVEIQLLKTQLEEAVNKKTELAFTVKMGKDLDALLKLEMKRAEKAEKRRLLKEGLDKLRKSLKVAEVSGEAAASGELALEKGQSSLDVTGKIRELKKLLKNLVEHTAKSKLAVPEDMSALLNKRHDADKKAEERRTLMLAIEKLEQAQTECVEWENKLNVLEKKLAVEAAKEKVCKACGQKLPHTH